METRFVIFLTLLVACHPSPTETARAPLAWAPCENGLQCTTLTVPARWERPAARPIPFFVAKLAATAPLRAQLFMLQGGPGGAGNEGVAIAQVLARLEPGVEIYLPDHRGTGRSARLGCAAEDAASDGGHAITDGEWPDCIAELKAAWGDDLAGFSSEGAARDLAELIERTRAGVPVLVWGVSYGTTLATRFLQLFPRGADGVILDSANWPDRTYADYDALWNEAARGLFAACGADALCAQKLGTDPWARLRALYDRLAAGHCAALGLDGPSLKNALAWMTAYEGLRELAPAVVYRLERCDDGDLRALHNLLHNLFEPGGALAFDDPLFSSVLSQHILLSENVTDTMPPDAELQRIVDESLVCIGAGPTVRAAASRWPRYPFPDRFRRWPETTTPVLSLSGGIDPFCPAARLDPPPHLQDGWVVFPTAAHGLVESTLVRRGQPTCGMQLLRGFLHDPHAPIDRACVAEVAPLDFHGAAARDLMGAGDAWENPKP
jgi:pimeloyl-ACP methyl ester carboxylesterase